MNTFDQLFQAVGKQPAVDLWHLPPDRLRDPVVLAQVKAALARETLLAPSDAHDILAQLVGLKNDQHFVVEFPEVYRGWQEVVDYLSFIALLFLLPAEVERLFKNRLLFAFRQGLAVQDITKTYLMVLGDDLIGSEQRQLLTRALQSNEERLGQGSVKSWLVDYEAVTAAKESRSALEQSEYLNKSKSVASLGLEDKKLLTQTIKLYDFLRFELALLPSLELELGLKKLPVPTLPVRAAIAPRPLGPPVEVQQPSPSLMPSAPTAIKTPEPAFFFDLQDETEVDALRQPGADAVRTAGNLDDQLRALADEVITAHKFSFKDEALKRRFVNLFVSRLKDVRSIVDVRETLLKETSAGGLGLLSDKAEQVIAIIERAKVEFEANPPTVALATIPEPVLVLPGAVPPPPQTPPGVILPKSDRVGGDADALPEGVVKPEPLPMTEDWRREMLEEIARLAPPDLSPLANRQSPGVPLTSSQLEVKSEVRPQLVDVKAPPRTLGPLEELKTLTLVDFRRLDPSPLEALAHVRAKIDLIGEASVTRHLEAVRAWQASPLYQLYLALGRECMEQGKLVAQVVEDRRAAGQPSLSEAEFDAIVDFNTKLRF